MATKKTRNDLNSVLLEGTLITEPTKASDNSRLFFSIETKSTARGRGSVTTQIFVPKGPYFELCSTLKIGQAVRVVGYIVFIDGYIGLGIMIEHIEIWKRSPQTATPKNAQEGA